jgi:hypothetical protein
MLRKHAFSLFVTFLFPSLLLGYPVDNVRYIPTSLGIVQRTPSTFYDQYRYSLLYYYGFTFKDPLIHLVTLEETHRYPEHIQSLELDYTLSQDNIIRRLFNPLVGVVQFAFNFTRRNGSNEHVIYEVDPYFAFRWANWSWNCFINTSFAIGEGISYDSSIPSLEKRSNSNTKRLLNYLMLEATFASPKAPRWQLVARIHHRSGAYGLYHAGNTGSNAVGLGLRYLFD